MPNPTDPAAATGLPSGRRAMLGRVPIAALATTTIVPASATVIGALRAPIPAIVEVQTAEKEQRNV